MGAPGAGAPMNTTTLTLLQLTPAEFHFRADTFHISINAQRRVKGHTDGAPAHKINFLRHCTL